MRKLLLLLPLFIVYSCQENETLLKLLDSAQQLTIYIDKDVGNKRTRTFAMETKSKEEILKLADYISDENSPDYKCSYDGVIQLKTTKGDVEMKFNLRSDCKHIVYTVDGKRYTKKLTQDGWEFLKSLYNK